MHTECSITAILAVLWVVATVGVHATVVPASEPLTPAPAPASHPPEPAGALRVGIPPEPFGVCPSGSPVSQLRCANFTLKLDYADPKSVETIGVFVTKFEDPSLAQPVGNLWYLNFGCDAWPSAEINPWVNLVATTLSYRIITPNMRGDGLSTPRLFCPADEQGGQDPPTPECAQQATQKYGTAYLSNFNLDNAANDINALFAAITPAQPGPNFLLATGYGAIWAQRVLALFPSLFTRVIISSYTTPTLYDFFATFGARSTVVRQVLSQCAQNPQCTGWLGAGVDPMSVYDSVMNMAESGTLPCNSQLQAKMAPTNGATWRDVYLAMFTALVAPDSPTAQPAFPPGATAPFIAALLYRVQRCNAADVAVINGMWDAIQANTPAPIPPAPLPPQSNAVCYPSKIMYANIMMNEMVRSDPLEVISTLQFSGMLARNNAYVQGWLSFFNAFGRWRQPAQNLNDGGKWYGKATNVAMFSGNLDPYLPNSIATASSLFYGGPTYVTLGNLGASPLVHRIPVGDTLVYCVRNCIMTFLIANNSLVKLDPCAYQTQALDLFGTSADSQYSDARSTYFGAAAGNIWDWIAPTSGCFVNPNVPFTLPPTPAPPTIRPTPKPTTPSPTSNNTRAGDDDGHASIIAAAVIGSLLGVGVLFFIGWKFCRREVKSNSFHNSVNYVPPATSLYNRYN